MKQTNMNKEIQEGNKYKKWLNEIIAESKHYPLLKKCDGKFNEKMLQHYYSLKLSATQVCNDMVTIT